jgi:PAS domain S-box-containing protein
MILSSGGSRGAWAHRARKDHKEQSTMAEGKKTILLVEDEAIIALAEQEDLEKLEYRVLTAFSGADAIHTYKDNDEIDLILMDIDLGKGIDGVQTAEIILEHREIPIVFLSSHTEPNIVKKTEKITSYGYILKESRMTVLDASIKMAFKLFEANKKLENEKEHLKTTLDSIGDAVIATDLSGNVTRMNPVAEKLTGWKLGDGDQRPIEEVFVIIDANTRIKAENPIRKVMESGIASGLPGETILISRNHVEYRIGDSTAPIINNAGKITGAVLVFRDITEKNKIREAFPNKDTRTYIAYEMFQEIVDSLPQSIFWKDSKSVYLGCNKNYAGMAGLSDPKSIIGKTDWELPWKKEATERFLVEESAIMKSNTSKYHVIESVIDSSGRSARLRINRVPLHDVNGNVDGIMAFISDISDHSVER